MNCRDCDTEMKKAKFTSDMYNMAQYVTIKEKGIFGGLFGIKKSSAVNCYICTNCGRIEFKAVNPENLK
jgi:hypothetical protein